MVELPELVVLLLLLPRPQPLRPLLPTHRPTRATQLPSEPLLLRLSLSLNERRLHQTFAVHLRQCHQARRRPLLNVAQLWPSHLEPTPGALALVAALVPSATPLSPLKPSSALAVVLRPPLEPQESPPLVANSNNLPRSPLMTSIALVAAVNSLVRSPKLSTVSGTRTAFRAKFATSPSCQQALFLTRATNQFARIATKPATLRSVPSAMIPSRQPTWRLEINSSTRNASNVPPAPKIYRLEENTG